MAHTARLRIIAAAIGLTVAGGLLVLFVDGILLSQLLSAPVFGPVWSALTRLGAAVMGTDPAPVDVATGSDLAWAWQMHLGWVLVGLVIGGAWGLVAARSVSASDPGGVQRITRILHAIARATLVVAMLQYGLAKVIPTQMGYMNLPAYQLQAIGDTEPFSMLWGYMAASTPYTVITGLIETSAAVLLIFSRTRVVGAILAVISLTQIVLLNLFYDVPVKLFAFELLIIAVLMTTPWRPLVRAVFPARHPGSTRSRLATVGTSVAVCAVAVLFALSAMKGIARADGMNTARDSRDGVWRATELLVDDRPALASDRTGPVWTSLAITLRGTAEHPATGSAQDSLVTQLPDGEVTAWGLRLDGNDFLVRAGATAEPFRLSVTQTSAGTLTVSGTVDGHRLVGTYERRTMERSGEIRLVQAPFDRTRPRL